MPTLNNLLSFTVNFNLTGTPALNIQAYAAVNSINQADLVGYFYIKQPDGLDRTGSYVASDVVWNGIAYNLFSIPLRLGSDGNYQRGAYTITFFASEPNYTPGQFTRVFNVQYIPVTQTLVKNFDCFTPSLSYSDTTNYAVGNYNITTSSSVWAATCPAGSVNSIISFIDLKIGGSYYDCLYTISYIKNILYTHQTDTWFSVTDWKTNNILAAAFIPASMSFLLTFLVAIKNARDAAANCAGNYVMLDELFEDADQIYQFMRTRVCAQNTIGLGNTFDEYYRITHNYQPQVYVNTNAAITAYDFTSGCGGSGGGTSAYSFASPLFTITAQSLLIAP